MGPPARIDAAGTPPAQGAVGPPARIDAAGRPLSIETRMREFWESRDPVPMSCGYKSIIHMVCDSF